MNNVQPRAARGWCAANRARLLIGVVASMLPGAVAFAQDSVVERIDHARALLEKYTESRQMISKERKEWALGRETLRDRIALMQRDLAAAQETLSETERSLEVLDAQRSELSGQLESAGRSLAVLEEAIVPLEARTRKLLARLPLPLRNRVDVLAQRIPAEDSPVTGRISERYQNIVGILNPANKFHREITQISEMRELAGGRSAEVTTIYLGLSEAFYVSADGVRAGRGVPSSEGWIWESNADFAAPVRQMLEILRSPATATYVRLPVKID